MKRTSQKKVRLRILPQIREQSPFYMAARRQRKERACHNVVRLEHPATERNLGSPDMELWLQDYK